MKILFVSPTTQAGTAQYTHNLMNALANRGHEIALVTSVDYELQHYKHDYQLLEVFDSYRPHPKKLWHLFCLLRTMKPQIIHYQGAQRPLTYLFTWFALAIMLNSAKFVYTPQDILPFSERSYHIRTLRIFYQRMSHIFLNADQNLKIATTLFRVPANKVTVLPIPDLLAFLRENLAVEQPPIPAGRKLILFFGQLQLRKGIDTLIKAFPKVLAEVPNAHLAIVGKPYMDISQYIHDIELLGIKKQVTIQAQYASFPEMAGYFEKAHTIVLPYKSGWNSGVITTAFGYKKPVIVTDIGCFDEVVQDKYNGLLVTPDDSNQLSEALIRILNNSTLYQQLCEGAALTADRHSWNDIAKTTEKVYENVLLQK